MHRSADLPNNDLAPQTIEFKCIYAYHAKENIGFSSGYLTPSSF